MTLQNFRLEVDQDGIALVTFDTPGRSMNVLSQAVIAEIGEIAEKVASDPAIKGAVLTSGKDTFCAGADLSELGSIMGASGLSEDEAKRAIYEGATAFKAPFRKLETCGKPVAAAINGLALGGGFEMTLACHYRIAADDSPGMKLGLPEAMVGVLPGGGGTQRLPRLVGVYNALDLMLQGKQVDVKKARELGLVHETAPKAEIVAKAKAWVKANPGAKAPWDDEKFKIPGGGPYHPQGIQVFGGASPLLRKNTYVNYPAQRYILSCVYEGLQVDIDTGLRIEGRYFAKLMVRPEARNMIRSIFLSKQDLDKGGRRPASQQKAPVKRIAVIGAGFMGAGIAGVSAQAGIEVALLDVDQAAAEKGKKHTADELAKSVSRGRLDQAKAEAILARITPTTDYGVLKDVDLVIEAVFENSELKHTIIKAAEEILPATAVFGSNTSTIPITSLAAASKRPEEFIGIHFFSPVEKMMLTEIIVGEKTGEHAISRAIDFVTAIKKTPIVVQDARGFYANRCVMRYIEQGLSMLADGYLPALIENGARMAGMPVGPLSLQDEVAIDLGYKILAQTRKDLGDKYVESPSDPIITAMYEMGRYGRKNGKGFYEYPTDGSKKRLWPELSRFAKNGVLPEDRQPPVQLVKDRILYAQAIEAARTMEEGIVTDPREADVGSILGWGFAPFTGGVLSFIDTIGAKAFVARADELAKDHGSPFEVPALLREMAKTGETFYGRFGGKKAA
jgi:3-hydroxyacyl-CoA dehydrogenase/enoyl-CoA hydratase/3-hydroxybutyryl-CoA epimerase